MITSDENLFQPARKVRIVKKLNVRSMPTTMAPRVDRFEPGRQVFVDALVEGEPYLERSAWYRIDSAKQYFWSGGAELEDLDIGQPGTQAAPSTPGRGEPMVKRRTNETILPLSTMDLSHVFGSFLTEPAAKKGAVNIIPPSWMKNNLVPFQHPVLDTITPRPPIVHHLALPHFQHVFDLIASLGLEEDILTVDGTFVPRYKNWNPASGQLSSHTWGVAIDLNQRFNSAGQQPALPGQIGCVRRLVPLFNAAGFAWGGHFTNGVDGMHFELARLNP